LTGIRLKCGLFAESSVSAKFVPLRFFQISVISRRAGLESCQLHFAAVQAGNILLRHFIVGQFAAQKMVERRGD